MTHPIVPVIAFVPSISLGLRDLVHAPAAAAAIGPQ